MTAIPFSVDIFKDAIKKLPQKERANLSMCCFEVSPDVNLDFLQYVASWQGDKADMYLAGNVKNLTYCGIPLSSENWTEEAPDLVLHGMHQEKVVVEKIEPRSV